VDARRWMAVRRAVVACVAICLFAGWASGAAFMKWEDAGKGLPLGEKGGVRELAVGGSPPLLFAIVDGVGLLKSTDTGNSWAAVEGDAACLKEPYAVAVAPDGKAAFAASATPKTGLWRSTDGGKSWAKCGDAAKGMASDDVEWITVYEKDPKLVLVGHRAGKAVSVSADGGDTWAAKAIGADVNAQLPFFASDTRWLLASRKDGAMFTTDDSGNTWTKAKGNVGIFPGPLPVIQTGDYLFSSVHHGTNKSTDGGKTWAYTMERHARVIGTLGPLLVREDREAIYGREARAMTVMLSSDFGNSWQDVTCALLDLIPEARRSQVVIENKVDPFAHVRFATAWAATPDGQLGFLGLGKAGLFRGRLMWSKGGPILGGERLSPPAILEGDTKTTGAIAVTAAAKFGNLKRVFADLSAIGGSDIELLDDGQQGDGAAGDRVYGGSFRLAKGVAAGPKALGLIAEDDAGRLNSLVVQLKVASIAEKKTVWDGDKFAHGLGWAAPQTPLIYVKPQTDEAKSGKVALEFHGDGAGWMGGGWNWHGWYPENSGTDITGFRNVSFSIKVLGDSPGGLSIKLNNSANRKTTKDASVGDYCPDLADGQWHEIVIPLVDLYGDKTEFDPRKAWELDFDSWEPKQRKFSVYIDDIGFDNRPVRAHSVWVRLPEERQAAALAKGAEVTATVDVAAEGTPISPWIYGAAMANRELAKEMGLTILRAGGNPVSPVNWKKGFGSKGSDWFYQNEGTEGPPEKSWLVTFHAANKPYGFESCLTIPMMGRVAKDGTSVAFDTRKYPDQTAWAGQSQPTDRLPHAGSGVQYVRDEKGNFVLDAKGNKKTRLIEPNPDDTSVELPPEEQADMLRFIIEKLGCGTADKGGVRFLCLDNEPCIWHSTHRGMHPKGCSYDELWERTKTYASLLKKIDPKVQIAFGTFFGWTAYFYSGLDMQLVSQGKGTWDDPPDHVAHGRVPLTKWLLKKLAEHEKATGQRLVDILDWHFYPQTGIYMAGKRGDPQFMEARVEETRVLWDPTWKDPTWMGKETDKVIRLVPLMREWVAECYPGLQTAIGEYNFGGDEDLSGGIAQAEILGIFAREGLDYALYWFAPAPNSPSYFAFKMFRNPDGQHTAFGDRCLPVAASAPFDVSVHTARDSKTGRLTFVLINKRVAKDARVRLKLSKPVAEQEVAFYEYSAADRFAIGQLPARKLSGDTLDIPLPAFSVVRFDLRP